MKTKIPYILPPCRVSRLLPHYVYYNGSICKTLHFDSEKILLKCCDTGEVFEIEPFDFIELFLLGEIEQCDDTVERGLPF